MQTFSVDNLDNCQRSTNCHTNFLLKKIQRIFRKHQNYLSLGLALSSVLIMSREMSFSFYRSKAILAITLHTNTQQKKMRFRQLRHFAQE